MQMELPNSPKVPHVGQLLTLPYRKSEIISSPTLGHSWPELCFANLQVPQILLSSLNVTSLFPVSPVYMKPKIPERLCLWLIRSSNYMHRRKECFVNILNWIMRSRREFYHTGESGRARWWDGNKQPSQVLVAPNDSNWLALLIIGW